MLEEKILRKYIKNAIGKIKENQRQQLKEERRLRNVIRRLIREGEEDTPHASTGINVLRDLLRDIIKQIEMEYKKLTSNQGQRDSFRKHYIKAVVNELSPEFTFFDSDEKFGKGEADAPVSLKEAADIKVDIEDVTPEADKSKYIKLGDEKLDGPEPEEDEEEQTSFQAIQGLDATGRAFAMDAFDNTKEQISDAFRSLADEDDRIVFYNYLITKLKLHFDRMDDELGVIEKEPTTKEYEKEKGYQSKLDTGETEDVGTPEEAPEPAPEGEEEGTKGLENIAKKLEEMITRESRKKKKNI